MPVVIWNLVFLSEFFKEVFRTFFTQVTYCDPPAYFTFSSLIYDLFQVLRFNTVWKVSVFGVILVRIQSECGKIQTRITPNTDTFYAVQSLQITKFGYFEVPWLHYTPAISGCRVWTILEKRYGNVFPTECRGSEISFSLTHIQFSSKSKLCQYTKGNPGTETWMKD